MGVFLLIVQILGALPSLIKAAEGIFGMVKGSGAIKKETVLDAISASLSIAAATGNDDAAKPAVRDAILGLASKATDGLVASYNAVGSWTGIPQGPGGDR